MTKLAELLQQPPKTIMRSIIQRIATGPELSKDISQEEARAGMNAILRGEVDHVQAAIFLIALRMKRETDDENMGILDAILDNTDVVTAPVAEVFDLSDPYNGYNRSLPAAPFLPVVLAACGLHVISHGVELMGPKFGITHRRVLRAAGIPVDLSVKDAAARLGDENIGWSYVDQKEFCTPLHNLADLRTNMVKRQVITTVEVLTSPVRGKNKTHFMSGYVHKPYTRVYSMLARHVGFDSCLLVRGVEGGIVPSLRQKGKMFYYHDMSEEKSLEFNPEDIGIKQSVRATPLPDNLPSAQKPDEPGADFDVRVAAKIAAEVGVAALGGEQGSSYDALVYAGALALWHMKKSDNLSDAATQIREVLDNGTALARFNAAMIK